MAEHRSDDGSDGPGRRGPLERLQHHLGHRFTRPDLLHRALSHRSWCAESGGEPSNERLEFLGDAVLGWVVADMAFRAHDDLAEGKLTDLRKSLVNAGALAEVAEELGVGECVLLGKGEDAAGGRRKPSILSDALEALFGAVYVDAGADAAFVVIERLLRPRLVDSALRLDHLDHKTRLQEAAARLGDLAPVYTVSEDGPDHDKWFRATVTLAGRDIGRGEGRSKKIAEQAAAAMACATIDGDETPRGTAED